MYCKGFHLLKALIYFYKNNQSVCKHYKVTDFSWHFVKYTSYPYNENCWSHWNLHHTSSVLRRVHSLFHRVQFSASSFNFHYRPVSLPSFTSCLRLFPRVPVTSILPYIFPSIECFRRWFLRKTWPIQLAFLLFIVCSMPLSSLTLCNTSFFTRSAQLTFSILLQHHTSKLSRYF